MFRKDTTMKLTIAICDDEQSACHHIESLLNNYQIEYDFEFEITTFTSSTDFISKYQKAGTFDIIFLDVEMPNISGLLVAQTIRNLPDYDVKIIFTSNYPEYMQNSFNVSAFQYLQKPITREQLHAQFTRIVQEFRTCASNSILVKHDGIEEVVLLKNLLYIETIKNQKNLLRYICNDKIFIGTGILKELETTLLVHDFFCPHRGLLINMRQVHFIKPNEIEMLNGDSIPLSRRREKEFRNYFNKILLQ